MSKTGHGQIIALNLVVGLRGGFDNRLNLERFKTDGTRQNDQLDNVDPALATLKACKKGLVASEPICQVFLTKASFDTGVDQRLTKCHLSLASDCFRHARHARCDIARG